MTTYKILHHNYLSNEHASKNVFTTQNFVKQNDLVADVTEEEINYDLIVVDGGVVILGDQYIHHHQGD